MYLGAKRRYINTLLFLSFFRDHPGEPVPEENFWTFMVQRKINTGRHTEHPTGRHSIRTNQCPPPPSDYDKVIKNGIFCIRKPDLVCRQKCTASNINRKATARDIYDTGRIVLHRNIEYKAVVPC